MDRAAAVRPTVVTFGPYVMDLTRRELASRAGDVVPLTRGEFNLLAALVEADVNPLYRDFLAEVVSSRPGETDARTVDSLVARLRRKLKQSGQEEDLIVTVTGIGYRFAGAIGLT
jgi:two-component system torCAD operon response regulator TorR